MALFDRRFKDYRFAEEINEKGKRTVVLDYIGNYFYFKDKERAMRAKPSPKLWLVPDCSALPSCMMASTV